MSKTHDHIANKASFRRINCSGFHKATGCVNSPKGYLCEGNHPLNCKHCPVYRQAAQIKDSPGVNLGAKSPLTDLIK